jgi:hypothetical protein
VGRCGLDLSVGGQGPEAGFYDHGKEPSVSTSRGEIVD